MLFFSEIELFAHLAFEEGVNPMEDDISEQTREYIIKILELHEAHIAVDEEMRKLDGLIEEAKRQYVQNVAADPGKDRQESDHLIKCIEAKLYEIDMKFKEQNSEFEVE